MNRVLKIPIAMFMLAVSLGVNLQGESRQKPAEPVLEFCGILKMVDDILVNVIFNGKSIVFFGVGDTKEALRLVEVAPDSSFIDVESNGETHRLWLRTARILESKEAEPEGFVIDDPTKLIELVKRKTVVVGGELSDEQIQLLVERQVELVTSDESPLPAELRVRSLASLLTQDKILLVGAGPISDEEAARHGLSPERVQELQVMNSMGVVLRAERKGNEPVGITLEP